jgi:hypothetical protein
MLLVLELGRPKLPADLPFLDNLMFDLGQVALVRAAALLKCASGCRRDSCDPSQLWEDRSQHRMHICGSSSSLGTGPLPEGAVLLLSPPQ